MDEEIYTPVIPESCREQFFSGNYRGVQALSNHGFRGCGISATQAPYSITRQQPVTHAVIYTQGGAGWLKSRGRTFSMEPGTVMILPVSVDHAYGAAGSWDILWFHMSPMSHWNFLVPNEPTVRDASYLSRLEVFGGEFLVELDAVNEDRGDSAGVLDGLANIFGVFVRRELMGAAPNDQFLSHRTQLDRLWTIVAERPGLPWTVGSLAREARVSQSHLHLLMKKLYGISAMEKVTRLRMKHASELLHDRSRKLAAIAENVGYESPYSFSRAFKRVVGISPDQYRASVSGSRS